jgi:hypothetical protein
MVIGAGAIGGLTGADTRRSAKLYDIVCEIDDGERRLGFHSCDSLEIYVRSIGKELP